MSYTDLIRELERLDPRFARIIQENFFSERAIEHCIQVAEGVIEFKRRYVLLCEFCVFGFLTYLQERGELPSGVTDELMRKIASAVREVVAEELRKRGYTVIKDSDFVEVRR